jgi:recombinational DNA repair protein RecT
MSQVIKLSQEVLNSPKTLTGIFDLEPLQKNCIANYMKTNGVAIEKATMHFEREKILALKLITSNKAFESCDRLTVYSSLIELFVSGRTLNEGECYLIPYGKVCQFQVGYKGRLAQMQEIETFKYVNTPQVVYTSDEFDYELGNEPKVLKHKPARKRAVDDQIEFVYLVIERHGKEAPITYIMSRSQVLNIRDRYSKPYIQYVEQCKANNIEIGKPIKIKRSGQNGDWVQTIDPPMWVTSEEEAFKKTITKHAYKWVPKNAKMRWVDSRVKNNFDPEEGGQEEETLDVEFGIDNADGTTTHVKAEAPKAATKKAAEKKPQAPTAAPTVSKDDLSEMQGDENIPYAETVNDNEPSTENKNGLPDLGNIDL